MAPGWRQSSELRVVGAAAADAITASLASRARHAGSDCTRDRAGNPAVASDAALWAIDQPARAGSSQPHRAPDGDGKVLRDPWATGRAAQYAARGRTRCTHAKSTRGAHGR